MQIRAGQHDDLAVMTVVRYALETQDQDLDTLRKYHAPLQFNLIEQRRPVVKIDRRSPWNIISVRIVRWLSKFFAVSTEIKELRQEIASCKEQLKHRDGAIANLIQMNNQSRVQLPSKHDMLVIEMQKRLTALKAQHQTKLELQREQLAKHMLEYKEKQSGAV